MLAVFQFENQLWGRSGARVTEQNSRIIQNRPNPGGGLLAQSASETASRPWGASRAQNPPCVPTQSPTSPLHHPPTQPRPQPTITRHVVLYLMCFMGTCGKELLCVNHVFTGKGDSKKQCVEQVMLQKYSACCERRSKEDQKQEHTLRAMKSASTQASVKTYTHRVLVELSTSLSFNPDSTIVSLVPMQENFAPAEDILVLQSPAVRDKSYCSCF